MPLPPVWTFHEFHCSLKWRKVSEVFGEREVGDEMFRTSEGFDNLWLKREYKTKHEQTSVVLRVLRAYCLTLRNIEPSTERKHANVGHCWTFGLKHQGLWKIPGKLKRACGVSQSLRIEEGEIGSSWHQITRSKEEEPQIGRDR